MAATCRMVGRREMQAVRKLLRKLLQQDSLMHRFIFLWIGFKKFLMKSRKEKQGEGQKKHCVFMKLWFPHRKVPSSSKSKSGRYEER